MNTKILFVINPISGNADKENAISLIKSWCQSLKQQSYFYKTTGNGDLQELKKIIEQEQPRKVVCVGGDGTVKMCAELLLNSNISLGIIPMGSANGMATELAISGDPRQALKVIEANITKRIDLLRFDNERLGIHISDLGANAGMVKYYEKNERRGFLGYAQAIVSHLSEVNTFGAQLQVDDGDSQKVRGIMIAISNAKRYGTGAVINHIGKIDDGKMEITVVKRLGFTNLAEHFMDWISGNSDHIEVLQAQKVQIKLDEPTSFQVDGEFIGEKTEVSAEVVPNCLSVLVPE